MIIEKIHGDFTACKVADIADINLNAPFCFVGKTDEETSLICMTADVPSCTVERDDGWRMMRLQGVLDFSMIGVLAKITAILAEHSIGILAVSTFNTDYILVKKENEDRALSALSQNGYLVLTGNPDGDIMDRGNDNTAE